MQVEPIKIEEFEQRLLDVKGAKVVTIIGRTVPDMRKTGNPYVGRVRKVSRCNGMINWIYQNAVNNQRLRENKEPDFEPKPRRWGVRLNGTPLVVHTKNKPKEIIKYLEFRALTHLQTQYFLDNAPIEKELIAEWLPPAKDNPRQDLDKEVILRDYMLCNVRQIEGLAGGLVVIEPTIQSA